MAYDILRASGNNQYGQMTDVDRANFGSQQSAQDFVLRKRLQDEALAREDAVRNQGLSAQERMQAQQIAAQKEIGGTFADRSALEDRRTDKMLSPQMEALRQQASNRAEDRGDMAPARELEAAKLRMRLSLYPQGNGTGAAPGGFQMTPDLQKRAFEHELGIGEDPSESFQRGLSEKILAALGGKAAEEGDVAGIQGVLNAAKSGDITKLPTNLGPTPQALSSTDVKGMLAAKVADFAKNASKTFGFNPTGDDMATIVQGRDQLAQAMKAEQPRLDMKAAIAAANQLIDAQLTPVIGTWGGGGARIKELRQRLGIVAGDAGSPAVPEGGFPLEGG